MKHASLKRIFSVLAKLVRHDITELVGEEGALLREIEVRPINIFRCKFKTKLTGRKWLAPLYRPVLGSFVVEPKTFAAVRENPNSCDFEYRDSKTGEAVIYTLSKKEWREKNFYFLLIPPERFKGGLGTVVQQIIQLRRSNSGRESNSSSGSSY